MSIYRIDDFCECEINPITQKPFDETWIMWRLVDTCEYKLKVGRFNGSCYTVKHTRHTIGWELSLGDFIEYNQSLSKNIIVVICAEDFEFAMSEYVGHTFREPILRDYEREYTVHSTSLECLNKILHDGELKSWNILKSENATADEMPIGSVLGDPKDFSDYIMFGKNIAGEFVVNSRQHGEIIMDENCEYKTGARLYFDMRRIVSDGLAVRDGAHIKVRDKLPLAPYLIFIATWENTGLKSRISTPKIFCEKANEKFNEVYKEYKNKGRENDEVP